MSADVEAFLRERHPEVRDLALWLREQVLRAEPDLTERVYAGWDGIGFRHPDLGYLCAIFPKPGEAHLLFEHGRRLPDPDGVLEGDGTQTRFIRVRARDPAFGELIGRYVGAAVVERLAR